jgi:hypothetical protein
MKPKTNYKLADLRDYETRSNFERHKYNWKTELFCWAVLAALFMEGTVVMLIGLGVAVLILWQKLGSPETGFLFGLMRAICGVTMGSLLFAGDIAAAGGLFMVIWLFLVIKDGMKENKSKQSLTVAGRHK